MTEATSKLDRADARAADYRDMLLVRRVEETILSLFSEGRVAGTTHTCVGQEANALAVMGQLDQTRDYVLSNHRNHGHFLCFGGPVKGLLGEIMGLPEGVCGGRGGSQHIKHGHFLSNGVQGGVAPIAAGIALGEKLAKSGGIVVACLGDGTLGQGVVYESLNMASLWELPVLFLVENNRYAQTTPIALGVSGSIVARAEPFGIRASEIDSTDIELLRPWAREQIDFVRTEQRPTWAVIHTYRLVPHSKGDETRSDDEIAAHAARDPLTVAGERLTGNVRAQLEAEVQNTIDTNLKELAQ